MKSLTFAEALKTGYKPLFESYQRRYVSRKINELDQSVFAAGGRRKGLYYVNLPCWKSSRYSVRLYLAPPDSSTTNSPCSECLQYLYGLSLQD